MSSAHAPFRRRLTAAQAGPEPNLHYWYKVAKDDYRRICDDAPWAQGLRYAPSPVKECHQCRAMRDADRRSGWAAFSLTYILKGVFAVSPEDVIYTPSLLDRNPNEGAAMKPVTLLTFSEFCIYPAGHDRREKIVQNFAEPQYGPSNAAVRGMFQRTHWKTGEIDTLVTAEPKVNKCRCDYAKVVENADALKHDYIALWREREASFFRVAPRHVDLSIGDLTVRVNPEVGMITRDGARVLKVWLGSRKMQKRRYEVCHYLMREAVKRPEWPGWPIGIWDVRRRALPVEPLLPDDIGRVVMDAAADFLRLLDG